MTPAAAIVIPVHGRSSLTLSCLKAVIADPDCDDAAIIVVDDGSSEDVAAGWPPRLRDRVTVARRESVGGFARACNLGARVAAACDVEALVFLNNDTVPERGWLRALVEHAAAHPRAAVIGSRLLYPDGSTQHAGIAFCEDRFPRHLYAGFPGDHPAVCRSRRVRAVSAACALMMREPFEQAGGFDEGYENGLEDVDLCLRLAEAGHEVHYCGQSVVRHLELATRGTRRDEMRAGEQRYLRDWGDRIQPDDVRHYLADGLLRIRYEAAYPARLAVSPHLAAIEDDDRELEANALLLMRSRQAFDLMREAVRLTVLRSEGPDPPQELFGERSDPLPGLDATPSGHADGGVSAGLSALLAETHDELRRRDELLAKLLYEVQRARYEGAEGLPDDPHPPVPPAQRFAYGEVPRRLRELVVKAVPPGEVVAVVSKGDDALLALDGREGWHFPRSSFDGEYTGVYPADSAAAIAHLEEVRSQGAGYIAFPVTAFWWLEHYRALRDHLDRSHRRVASDPDGGVVYSLQAAGDTRPTEDRARQEAAA